MVDRNLRDFKGRVGRIERIHDAGGGFEAEGTLGMSDYRTRRRSRAPRWLGVICVSIFILFLLKAGLHVVIGADAYDQKVAALRDGGVLDRFGSYVLQADPVTLAIAAQMRRLIR